MIKIKGLVSTIQHQCAYAAACKAAGKGRGAAARPRRAGTAGARPAEVRDDAAEVGEMAWWQGPAAERSLGRQFSCFSLLLR